MINVLLGMLQLITIIIISVYEYKQKSTILFLWATLLLMFGFPHILSIFTGISNYNDNVMIKASIFVILFNFLYMCTKIILYGRFDRSQSSKESKVHNNKKSDIGSLEECHRIDSKATKLHFLLLMLSFFILIFYSIKYLGGIANSSWGAFRKINSDLGTRSLLRYATFVFFGSAGVSLVYFRNKKNVVALFSLIIIVLYSLITGNRITILPAIITIILIYIFLDDMKLSFKKIVTFGFIGFFVLYIVYFLRLLRIYNGVYNLISNYNFIELNTQVFEMLLNGDGELGLRKAFYHFIYYDNNFANFNKGHTYIRLLLIAIPTSLIPGIKPPDFAISMGSAWSMNPYNTSYSMHPTLYGDSFANLWWVGILLGIFWGLFSYKIDKFIYKKDEITKLMLMALFSTVYVIVGRGSVYNGLFIAFIGTIIILTVNLISRVKL